MPRIALKMHLKMGVVAEYQRRHEEIWPELATRLKVVVVSDYSIFLDEAANMLFALQHMNHNNSAGKLPDSPAVRKWWDDKAPLMEVRLDKSSVTKSLHEVFHLAQPSNDETKGISSH